VKARRRPSPTHRAAASTSREPDTDRACPAIAPRCAGSRGSPPCKPDHRPVVAHPSASGPASGAIEKFVSTAHPSTRASSSPRSVRGLLPLKRPSRGFGTTSREFDDIGAQEIDASEEISYESDGLYVESATAGGGGGGGEEPEFVSSFFGHCEDQYGRNARRCRRVWTRKGKALCWAAIMVVYADCRYNES
jgi:hypothetical protein